jgi:3-oxoacyl-[acyl-carrier-protein] synthase-1
MSRLVQMAALAIDECLAQTSASADRIALILGVREAWRKHPDLDDAAWIPAIEAELGTCFHEQSRVLPQGHVSTFEGLRVARRLIQTGQVSTCIVGGVDSLLNVFDLRRLANAYRLLGPFADKGLAPGEGAVFVLVTALSGKPDAESVLVMGIGSAADDPEAAQAADGCPTGRGLEQALQLAMEDSGLPESAIDLRISDMNGEPFRADDSLLAAIRFYRTYRHHLEIWHFADCVGDLGAASGAMLLTMGYTALQQHCTPGAVAMCESASDDGARAGCVIARIDRSSPTASAGFAI